MTSRDAGAMGLAQQRFRPGATLLRLAVDDSTGLVYVGAVNYVYQLTPDRLELVQVAITGNDLICLWVIWLKARL